MAILPVIQAVGAGINAFNALSSASSASGGSKPSTAQPTAADQEDRFLKLLVAQMKSQDPLNPLDNAQVTTQMAQISTVSGVDKLNASIGKLSQSLLSAQSLQSAGVIGHQVLAAGATLALGATGGSGAVELAQAADRVQVTITTPGGAIVRRLELGGQDAGIVNFQWDGMTDSGGRAPAGNYQIQVAAASAGQSVPVTALTAGKVTSVTLSGSDVQLNLDNGSRLPVGDVQRIL